MSRLCLLCVLCVCVSVPMEAQRVTRRDRKTGGSKPRPLSDAPQRQEDTLLPGQCHVGWMVLFDGAMWSNKPCSVCQCQAGSVRCHSVPCAGSNRQQAVAPRAKRPSTEEEDKETKRSFQKMSRGGRVKVESAAALGVIKQRKEDRTSVKTSLPLATVKPVLVKKSKQEVVKTGHYDSNARPVSRQTRGRKAAVSNPALNTLSHHNPSSKEEDDDQSYHDDDDDDDDDDYYVGRPMSVPVEQEDPRRAGVEDTLHSVTRTPKSQVVPTPTKKPVRAPGGSVRVPGGQVKVPGGQGRSVVTFPQKPSFMESLPSGCLLSESLVACGSTGLGHMPIITDQGVKILYLADNRISKIPSRALAGLPNLEWLDLSKNKLDDSSLSPHLFQNLTRLRRLILDGNNLTKIPAFLPPSLVELKINDNKLSALTPSSFKGLSKLLTLELEDNLFHDGNVSPLTFRPLRKLVYLRLEDNRFRAIPSGLPTSIQELHLSDNRIEEVHAGILNKTVHLRILDLSHNRIREDRISREAWIHLLKLDTLDLSHNKLVHVPSFLPEALRQLVLHHNQIERVPGYVFGHMRPGLDSLHLSHNRLNDDGIDNVSFLGLSTSLSELLLDHNHFHSVPRGLLKLKNLQMLRLNDNFISYIPLNALCDTRSSEDSLLLSVHLENNMIDRRLIPPTAFSCIKTYHSILLRPQNFEAHE